jgi:hypothetical protein
VSSTNGVPLGQIQVGADTFSSNFGGISSGPLTFGSQLAHELANSSTAAAGTLAVSGLFGQTNSSPQDFAAAAIAVDGGSAAHDYVVATELSAQSGVPVGSFLTSVPPTLKATFDSLAQQYGIGSDQFQQAASAAGVTYYGQPTTTGISTNANLSLTNYYMAEYAVEITGINAFDLGHQINNSNVTVQGGVVTISGIPIVSGDSVTHDTISISKTSDSAVVCTSTQDESGNITAQVKVQTPSTDLASVPALNLENLSALPTINGDQTLTVPTSAGTYHIDPATNSITDSGAVTATINGQTVTILGLGGATPFALISNDNSVSTAGAVSSNRLRAIYCHRALRRRQPAAAPHTPTRLTDMLARLTRSTPDLSSFLQLLLFVHISDSARNLAGLVKDVGRVKYGPYTHFPDANRKNCTTLSHF